MHGINIVVHGCRGKNCTTVALRLPNLRCSFTDEEMLDFIFYSGGGIQHPSQALREDHSKVYFLQRGRLLHALFSLNFGKVSGGSLCYLIGNEG